MMVTCKLCDKEFLTEADSHALYFDKGEWVVNCGCYFTKPLEAENLQLKAQLEEYREKAWKYDELSK